MRLFNGVRDENEPVIDDRYVSKTGNTLTIRTETDSNKIANAVIAFAIARLECHYEPNVILDARHLDVGQLILIRELVRTKAERRKELTLQTLDTTPTDHILFPFKKASKPCTALRS